MITITPKAEQQLKSLLKQKENEELGLRLFITEGGCSGLNYGMALTEPSEEDIVHEQNGIKLFVDPLSLMYIQGCEIDYDDALIGGGFKVNNPLATRTCACGQSFRTSTNRGRPGFCS